METLTSVALEDRATPHVLTHTWLLAVYLLLCMFNLGYVWEPENQRWSTRWIPRGRDSKYR